MATKKKETPKKRIRPVVEEVVEEVVETPVKETSGVSVEPDFSAPEKKEEPTATEVIEPEVEEVEEEVTETETEEPEAPEPVKESAGEEPVEEVATEEVAAEETSAEEPAETATSTATSDEEEKTQPKDDQPSAEVVHEHKMSIKSILLIALVSALVAAFVSGGVYVYLNGVNSLKRDTETEDVVEEDVADEATEEPKATEEPTEAEVLDVSEYKLQVLNGSGEIGAAGKASDVLETGGFVIADTGNAANYDFEESVIEVKESVSEEVVTKLTETLETTYEVKLSKTELDEDGDYDIVVTVGTD